MSLSSVQDYQQCLIPKEIIPGPDWVIIIGASISIICYIYVIVQCYVYKTPEFVGHPTSMAVYKYIIEAIFVCQFFFIATPSDPARFYSDKYFYDSSKVCPPNACCASKFSAAWAFISQFCLLSSELWGAAICRDLQLAYTNPFSSYQENKRFFLITITLVSILSGFLLLFVAAEPYQIGVSETAFIWIQPDRDSFYNPLANAMYFYWFILFFLYTVVIVCRYSGGEDMNLAGTVSTRLPTMKKARRFVLGYCSYWLVVVIVEFIYLLSTNSIGPGKHQTYSMLGYCLAFRGPYSLSIMFYSNWEYLTWESVLPFIYKSSDPTAGDALTGVAEKLALAPHLNKALRAEILFFTSEGIRVSALECVARKRADNARRIIEQKTDTTGATYLSDDDILGEIDSLKKDKSRIIASKATDYNNEAYVFTPALTSHAYGGTSAIQTMMATANDSRAPSEAARRSDANSTIYRNERFGRGGSRMQSSDIQSSWMERSSQRNGSVFRSSLSSDFEGRGSVSLRSSLDETQLQRLNVLEEGQEKELESLVEGYIQDHIPLAERSSLDANALRTSFGLGLGLRNKVSPSMLDIAPISGKFGMETLQEHQSEGGADDIESNTDSQSASGILHVMPRTQDSGNIELSDRSASERSRQSDTQIPHPRDSTNSVMTNDSSRDTVIAAHDPVVQSKAARKKLAGKASDPLDLQSNQRSKDDDEEEEEKEEGGLSQGGKGSQRGPLDGSDTLISEDSGLWKVRKSMFTSELGGSSFSSVRSSVVNETVNRNLSRFDSMKSKFMSLFSQSLYEFEFTDYCPRMFSLVRKLCGITEVDYAAAFESVKGENFSEGRSGAFTFFSKNGEFLVKTQKPSDLAALRLMLPDYVRYLSKNRNSLMIRYLGAHKIKMYGKELYFVVMANIFPKDVAIHERYDLKGSWVMRHGQAGVQVTGRGQVMRKESPLYLDNDIHQSIELHPAAAKAIFKQLKSDAQFLCSQNLMDYSLLIGVVKSRMEVLDNVVPIEYSTELLANMTRDNPFLLDKTGGLRPVYVEGASTYYLGLIDVLQKWDFWKKAEYYTKTWVLGYEREGISAIESKRYCKRFVDRVVHKMFPGVEDPEEVPRSGYGSTRGTRANSVNTDSSGRDSVNSTTNQKAPSIKQGSHGFYSHSNPAAQNQIDSPMHSEHLKELLIAAGSGTDSGSGTASKEASGVSSSAIGARLGSDLYPGLNNSISPLSINRPNSTMGRSSLLVPMTGYNPGNGNSTSSALYPELAANVNTAPVKISAVRVSRQNSNATPQPNAVNTSSSSNTPARSAPIAMPGARHAS